MAVWISGILILPVLFFVEFGGLHINVTDPESETGYFDAHCEDFKPIIDQCKGRMKVLDKDAQKPNSEPRNGQVHVQCEDLKVIIELCRRHLKIHDRKKKPGKILKPGKKPSKPGKNSAKPGKEPPKPGKKPPKPGKKPPKKGKKGKKGGKPNKPTQKPDMATSIASTNPETITVVTTATTTIPEEGCSMEPKNYNLSEGDGLTISSPGYLQKQNYSNNLRCEWIFTAPPGEKVSFTMLNINTEYGYDIVAIFDGISGDKGKARFLTTMSGHENQEAVISSNEKMRITFTSDINVNKIGFQANVIAFKKADLPEFTWIDLFNIYIRFPNGMNESIQLILVSEVENACLFEGKTSETSLMITSPSSSDGCHSLDQYLEIMVKSTHLKKKKAIYTLKDGKLHQIDKTTFENNEVSRKRNVSKIEVPQKLRMPIQFGYDLGLKNKFKKYGQGTAYIRKRIQEMFYASKWGLKEIFNQTKFELILEKKIIFINEELKMNNSALLKSRKYQLREDIPIIILCAEDYENNIKGLSFRSGACRKDKERYGVAMVVWRDDGGLAGDVLEHEMGHLIGGVHNEKHATETDVGHSDFNSNNVNFWFNLAGSRCYGKNCSHPPSKPHGHWSCYTDFQRCDLKCDAGFDSVFSTIQCENGNWSDSINDMGCSPSVLILAGGDGNERNIEAYDPTTGSVSCTNFPPPLDQDWSGHTSFIHHGTVYMCGGDTTQSICISINSKLNIWRTHTLLSPRQWGSSSIVMDNTLFLIGGWDNNLLYTEAVSSPLPLNHKSLFTAVPNLSYKGHNQCTVKIDRDSFVITGGVHSLGVVTIYNVVDETTETLDQLQQARERHGCVLLEVDMILWIIVTVGYDGEEYLKTAEILDITDTENNWNNIGNLNVGREGHGMAVTEKGVVVMGGIDSGRNTLKSVELLNWTSKKWKLMDPSLPKAIVYFGGVMKIPAALFECKTQLISIPVCSLLPSKQNGNWSCDSTNTKCSLTCDPGFVSLFMTTMYSSGGTWKGINKMECSPSVLLLAGGIGAEKDVELYDLNTGSISCSNIPPPLDQEWRDHTSFNHHGTVYMCGGLYTKSICISINSQFNNWRTHTLLKFRYRHSSVVMDNTLFLIGGYSNGYLEAVSTPLPLNDKPFFTVVSNLAYKGEFQCTVKIDRDSFVITGGSIHPSYFRDVTRYNIVDETSETLDQLQQAREGHGCVILEIDTKRWIIVTGGKYLYDEWQYLKTTEVLDLTDAGNKWNYIGDLNVMRRGHGMAVTERGVVAMGGYGQEKSVELLNWTSKKWKLIKPSMEKARYRYGGVVEIPAETFGCETHPIDIAECDGEYQYNTEYIGGEVMDVPEYQTCHSLCENQDDCGAWTWNAQKECRINRIITTTAAVTTTTTAVPTTTIATVSVPEYIKVSSNGGAATAQESKMGIYKLQDAYHNNFPVWKKDGEEIYLFVNGLQAWCIGPNLESNGAWIYNIKKNPTPLTLTDGWRYSDSGWKTDNTIRIETVTVLVPEYINVSSNGGATIAHGRLMGVYKLQDEYHNNFPVWKKDWEDKYLFVNGLQAWCIGPDLESNGAWIYNIKKNPTPLTLTDGWRYSDSGWKTDNTIRIETVTGGAKTLNDFLRGVLKPKLNTPPPSNTMCLTSPEYPSNYPDNSDTTQHFSLPYGDAIEITFEHFDVDGSSGCKYDYVQFFDGNGKAVGTKLCSYSLPNKLTIKTSTASVHFHSDGSINKKGFIFCYAPGTLVPTATTSTTTISDSTTFTSTTIPIQPTTTTNQLQPILTTIQVQSTDGSISGLKNACKPKCYLVLGSQEEASTNTQYCNDDTGTSIGCKDMKDIIHMEPDDFEKYDDILVCHETIESSICEPVSYNMVGVICNKQPSIVTNSIYSRLNKYSYTKNNYGWGWGR